MRVSICVYTVTRSCASESSKLRWSNTICRISTDVWCSALSQRLLTGPTVARLRGWKGARLKGNKLEFSDSVMWWCETDLKLITWDLPSPQSSDAGSSTIHCAPEGRGWGVRSQTVLLSSCSSSLSMSVRRSLHRIHKNKVVMLCMLHFRNYWRNSDLILCWKSRIIKIFDDIWVWRATVELYWQGNS
jgi:hypothetical protein